MPQFTLRQPDPKDGAAIHEMLQPYRPYVGTSPIYTYLLICAHHAATSVVVEDETGQIVGFISGYLVPRRPEDTLFIWEIGVREGYHGNGLCMRMMQELYDRLKPAYVEATVNPSNDPSIRRFRKLAHLYGGECVSQTMFPAAYFGQSAHEDEVLYRLGPLKERSTKE